MYEDFLKFLLGAITALNSLPADGEWYIGRVPVMYDGEVQGYLVDEVGGAWSYQPGAAA